MLEPHGRLSFERDRAREPYERRDRIEQSTRRRGRKRSDAAADDAAGVPIPVWKFERLLRQAVCAVELRKKSGGRLHGMTGRSVAAGQERRMQMGDAFESAANAADEELSTPYRAVVAVPRAVEG